MLCAGLLVAVFISMSACGMTIKHASSSGIETTNDTKTASGKETPAGTESASGTETASGTKPAIAQIPNPLLYHKTIEEASKVVGFTFIIPVKIPEGYVQDEIVTINKEIAQVNYKNGENIITYRTAKGNSDISGDYNEYPSTRIINAGDFSITAKGDGRSVHVAYWTNDDFSYSILFSVDVSDDELSEIIESI